MSRRVSVVLTSAFLASSLMLGACGAPASNSESTADSTSTQSTEPTATDVSQAILGEWKTAMCEISERGLIYSGDLTQIIGELGNATFSFDSAGTGKFSIGGKAYDYTWKKEDSSTVIITFEDPDLVGYREAYFDYDVVNNMIISNIKDDSGDIKFACTHDGDLEHGTTIDMSRAKDVTSIDQVAGTWTIYGFCRKGLLATGSVDALADFIGDEDYTALLIADDGTVGNRGGGAVGTLTIGDDGAKLLQDSLVFANIKLYDDGSLIMDTSELTGNEMLILFQ